MKNIYRLKHSDTSTLQSVVIETFKDDKFIEGWLMTVGSQNIPELRHSTWKVDDPELVPIVVGAV